MPSRSESARGRAAAPARRRSGIVLAALVGLCLPFLGGCLDRALGALFAPQAVAAGTAGRAAGDAARSAQAQPAIDAAQTAGDLDRWLKDHPDDPGAGRIKSIRDRFAQATAPVPVRPTRAGDDPQRRIAWDRQVYGEGMRRSGMRMGDAYYRFAEVEWLGRPRRTGDRLRLGQIDDPERIGAPLGGGAERAASAWNRLDIDPIRLGGKPLEIAGGP